MYRQIVARIAYTKEIFRITYNHNDWRLFFMNTVDVVRNRILTLCEERHISINKLANISGMPPSSIKNILYQKSKNPKVLTIKMLCDGLGITLGEFFSTPEFDSLEQELK